MTYLVQIIMKIGGFLLRIFEAKEGEKVLEKEHEW